MAERGGSRGWGAGHYTMSRGDCALFLGAIAINAGAALWGLFSWCERGALIGLVGGYCNLCCCLWVILKNGKYWPGLSYRGR